MSVLRLTLRTMSVLVLSCVPLQPLFAQEGTGTNYETRLDGLEEQMRTMNGRLEQLEYGLKRLDTSLQRMQTDTDSRLQRLEQGAVAPQPAQVYAQPQPVANNTIATSAEPIQPVNGSLGAIKLQDGRVTGAISNPQAPPLPQAPPDYGLTPQEQYDRAFDLLRQANYEEAGDAFEAFISANPKDKLVDNAKYWYGETLYVRGKYDTSAVAFADAYQQNPQGTKAPDSLLKLAMSLEALNKASDACATLDSLKGKYPNASASIRTRADTERGKLKCDASSAR